MAGCGSASIWARIACLMLVIALPLHIAGYTTVYWLTVYTVAENYAAGIGLWKMENCSSNAHSKSCKTSLDVPASYQTGVFLATQAFETVALPFLAFSTLCSVLYVFVQRLRTHHLTITVVILCFLTASFSFIGMILHVTSIPLKHYVNYSFGLTVVALLLTFFAGLLMYADVRRYVILDSAVIYTAPAPEKLHQDEYKNTKYYNEYSWESNDRYSSDKEREARYDNKRTEILHYHNNSREVSEDSFVSSPPSYRNVETHCGIDGKFRMTARTERTLSLLNPDVYLGNNDLTDVDQY